MTQVFNFKVMEVSGATKEEALAKAPFSIMGDATAAYKNWKKKQTNGVTDTDKKQFYLDYLAAKSKNVPGVGFAITVEAAVKDTRMNPYTVLDYKNTDGTRKYVKTYQLLDKDTNQILLETQGTKAKAKELGKELVRNGFKGTIVGNCTKTIVNGTAKAFEIKYTPSKDSQVGTYLVFGFEA